MTRIYLLILGTICSILSNAQNFEFNGFRFSVLRGEKCELIEAPNYEEVKIPSEVEYENVIYNVVSIAQSAFSNHNEVKKLWIPSSISSINQAFTGCNINELHIEDIASWCAVEFLSPMYSTPFYYDCNLFLIDEQIEHLIIPEGVKIINSSAFQYTKIKELSLPSSLEKIEESAFVYCNELERIHFSEGLKTIAEGSFMGCAKLDLINLPVSLEELGRIAFADCKTLSGLNIPENVKTIGEQLCDGNISLVTAKIHTPISTIPRFTFRGCENLSSVVISEGTGYISEGAFQNCSHLKSLILPKTIYGLGDDAFSGCVRIDSITSYSIYPPGCGDNCFKGVDKDIVVLVPAASLADYCTADGWSNFDNIEVIKGSGITQIEISPTSASLAIGESIKLGTIVTPSDATSTDVLWSSTNTSVAVVSQDGNVEAIAEGEAIIIASTQDGSNLSATCNISVYNDIILISKIILNPVNIEGDENESATINAVIIPENATNKQLKWYSSNDNVAVVNDGVVILVKRGAAIITAEALDGSNVKSECTVVVSDGAGIESISEDKNTDVKILNLSGQLIYQGIYSEANIEPGVYIILYNGKSFKVNID